MEELRSWWEVPSIAHFCSLFRAAFDLSDFDIEDLEDGLLESEKETGCEFLTDLVCKLLNGCYGRDDICSFNYDLYIKDIIKYKWDSTENPILKKNTFTELTLREKVEVIHSICEYRLDGEDVMELLKGFDGDSMRVEPLGKDKEGGLYWYFYGSRLYKEDPEPKKELTKEQKRKQERERRRERKKEQQRKRKLEKEQRKQEKIQRRTARRVEKKRLLELKKKEEEEESKGKRRRSGRIQKIHEQQLMESTSESSSESSSSEEESEESSSEEVSEEEEEKESNSDTEVEEASSTVEKTPKKENKKQTTSKGKKSPEKPKPTPVEKKAGKRQPPSRKKRPSRAKQEEEIPENTRRSGRLRQKNARGQIDDRQSDSGIDDSDKNCSDSDNDEDARSVTSEISRRSARSEVSTRSDSVKKDLPKRSTRSDRKAGKSKETEKPNTSKNEANSEAKSMKGRGRPRKILEQDTAKDDEENDHVEGGSEIKSGKDLEKPKGRGRPRKAVDHTDSDDKLKEKGSSVDKEIDHGNGDNSAKGRGRRKSGRVIDNNERNNDHEDNGSDSETKSEKDSEKPRTRGKPRKSADLSKDPEGSNENDDINCEENNMDHDDENVEKPESLMTRKRRLRYSTDSNSNKNQEEKEKMNVKTDMGTEKLDISEEKAEVKVEMVTRTETKMETGTENEKDLANDCDGNSTEESSKDTTKSEPSEGESVKTETVTEESKTLNEEESSDAKSKAENGIKDEKDVDSTVVKEEIQPNGEENEEKKSLKEENADTKEIKEETDEEEKLTSVQSPEVKPRPKPTPPPKFKTGSRWHLICTTLDDWINLAEWFKESATRCEKALAKVIEEDFLPVLPEIIETREKEKERRQRENELRKSARITQKQREKLEQEKILAEAAAAEEKARKEAEEERRLKEEHERLEHENKLREERVKAREERAKRLSMREERARLMAEGKDIPPELIYTGLPAQRYKDDFDSDDSKPDFLDDESFQALQKVIDGMRNHKDCWPFLEPVTEEQAPGYHDVIKRPMDLSKIEKKVELREYRTQHHFLSDFRLMFNNCRRFNGVDSDFTDCARTMEKHLKNLVKKHLLEQPTDSYYDDEDFVSSSGRAATQVEKKFRPKRQAGTKALQTVQKALKDDAEEISDEDVEVQTEPVKKRKIMTEEAISPSVRSLLLQEMIEFKRKRAEQRASGQVVTTKPPTTQGIMIMPREEIPTDGVLRLAASREIRWKIDPKNVSIRQGLTDSGRTSTVVKTPDAKSFPSYPRMGRPPISSVTQAQSSVGQSPSQNQAMPAANSTPTVRPQNTLNVVHKKAVGLAPGQKIIKILASAPGTGIHAVRQTAESVKVSSDGFLILNGKPTSIKVTPNTKIVIQPQGTGDTQDGTQGTEADGSGPGVGSPLGKEVVIKKIPTPAGLQPLSDTEASVSIQPVRQNEQVQQVQRTAPQNQPPQNHSHFNANIGQGHGPARTVAGNQPGMVPGRPTVQTPRIVNVTGQQQSVVSSPGTNPSHTMDPNSIEARKQQLDIAQRLLAAKRRQLMQNGPISQKVARLEKDTSPLISSPNVPMNQQRVVNSNLDQVNSLSSNVLQNVNISNDILDSYYSVMNESGGQKEFTAVPLTNIQQSGVQGTSLTNVQQQSVPGTPVKNVQPGVQGSPSVPKNIPVPQHTPVNIDRLLHSSPPSKNSVIGTPVTVAKSAVSEGHKTMSISALTTALARSIAAGNIQLNRPAPQKGTVQPLAAVQNTNVVNPSQLTSQARPVPSGSDPSKSVVINVDPKGSMTQQYLNVSQPVQVQSPQVIGQTIVQSPQVIGQSVVQSPQVLGQAVQYVTQPLQTLNQSPQIIGQTGQIVNQSVGQTAQIVNQPVCQTAQIMNQQVLQKSPSLNANSSIAELLKSTVINNSVADLLTTDSTGLQNQILSSLANVQSQQVQSLATVPQKQTFLTSVQNQSLASQSQLKPIEALFTGQTSPLMPESTKVRQFSPYKPGVSNISPPKSDRQNLFDVFEAGKTVTEVSPNKSDDFGFASLASDKIPIPVRQSVVMATSDEALSRAQKPVVTVTDRGSEFVGSPLLNSSVMKALKSKLSPGKPAAGAQQTQLPNMCVEDPIPRSDPIVTSPNNTNPAPDTSVIPNPVVLGHESSNLVDTKDHELSNLTTNNIIKVEDILKCSETLMLDESELGEGELNDTEVTDDSLEDKDHKNLDEDAEGTKECLKSENNSNTVTKRNRFTVKSVISTECIVKEGSSANGIEAEAWDCRKFNESGTADNTGSIEMEDPANTTRNIECEAMDTAECIKNVGTEFIESADSNVIVIKMDCGEATQNIIGMNVEDLGLKECLKEGTQEDFKDITAFEQDGNNNTKDRALEINKNKIECEVSDSCTTKMHNRKEIDMSDEEKYGDKNEVAVDVNGNIYTTRAELMPANEKNIVKKRSERTVLDLSDPELFMTKNQEPAIVLTVKNESELTPENSLGQSYDENRAGLEDVNLEDYLLKGMAFSRTKKHNYTVFDYASKEEKDLDNVTTDSEHNHWDEKKIYSRIDTKDHEAELEQSESFDKNHEDIEHKLHCDEQFGEEFYRSLLCRQNAADKSLFKINASVTEPTPEQKRKEQYVGITLSSSDVKNDVKKDPDKVQNDIKCENDNREFKSNRKRTKILIQTKLGDGRVLRRKIWRIKSSDNGDGIEIKEGQKNEKEPNDCSVWKKTKDLSKCKLLKGIDKCKKNEKEENETSGQVWRIKSPEDVGKKDKQEPSTETAGLEPVIICSTKKSGMVHTQEKSDHVFQPFKFSKSLLTPKNKANIISSTRNIQEKHSKEKVESVLKQYKFSKSILERSSGPPRGILIPNSQIDHLTYDRNKLPNVRDIISDRRPLRATSAKPKPKKSLPLPPVHCYYSPPKLYKLRGVSSDSAISVTSGLDTEDPDLSNEMIVTKLRQLQSYNNEDTPTQEWKLKGIHSDSMVDYTLVRNDEEKAIPSAEEGQTVGEDVENTLRYRTIPYSGSLYDHEQMKKRRRVVLNAKPTVFTKQNYRSLLGPSVQTCKKSLSFQDGQDNRGFNDSDCDSYVHELASNPLLNDMHVDVVCGSPSPSFINHFIGGGDGSDAYHNITSHEYDITGGSLPFDDDHLIMDNMNLLSDFIGTSSIPVLNEDSTSSGSLPVLNDYPMNEDHDLNRIENDIFELQDQYLKPVEQTVSSPLMMFSTVASKVGVQDQAQGNLVNKQVVIGTLPDSLRQVQNVSISIAESTPSWQQNSQTLGSVQNKVVVERLPNVQTLFGGGTENVSAMESNVNSQSTSLPVSNQVKTIESIFAENNTNTSATGSIASLLAANTGQPTVSLGLENKSPQISSPFSPQMLMNNATYVGSINIPENQHGTTTMGSTSADSGQKLSAIEAMFLRGLQGVQQTAVPQTPENVTSGENIAENGERMESEKEFVAVKLDQT